MKTQFSNWKKLLALLACSGLCFGTQVQAQRGGFGGFGGFNRFNNNNNNNSSSSQQQYTPNGQVGSATFSLDDSGNLIVIGDDATINQIKDVVSSLDRPQPQVLIKVVFLEVQHNNASDIGIEGAYGHEFGNSMTGIVANAFGASSLGTVFSPTNLNAFGQPIGAFAPNPPGAGLYQILGSDFQATLRAIAQAGKVQLLSRPSILARDRQPATIQVGQDVPLITGVNFTTFGNQINTVTYEPVGIILNVTPYITPDGLVQMIVSPSTSQLDATQTVPISAGVSAPVIDMRSADTVAITPDGQTVVIGGLMGSAKSSNESKIPFLGDIPVLGNLFKRRTKSDVKTELLIFLTPHIVRTPSELAGMSEQERAHALTPHSVDEQELDRFLEHVPVKPEN